LAQWFTWAILSPSAPGSADEETEVTTTEHQGLTDKTAHGGSSKSFQAIRGGALSIFLRQVRRGFTG
jgi:hypothetical protein